MKQVVVGGEPVIDGRVRFVTAIAFGIGLSFHGDKVAVDLRSNGASPPRPHFYASGELD